MQESDIQVLSSLTRSLVDKTYSLSITLCQCICHAILNAESNVVNTMIALVEPFLDSTVWRCRLQQFQLNLTTLQKSCLHLLIRNLFYCVALKSQNVFEIRKSFLNARNCYS